MPSYRPGISVVSRSAPTPRGIPTNTGTWFVVGTAQKGSTTVPQLLRSMNDYTTYFGVRSVGSTVYSAFDALETFFREGGSQAFMIRVEGASSAASTKTLLDGAAGNSLKITAKSVGTWGNALSVQVVAGVTGGTYVLVVLNSGVEVDRSPELSTTTAALAWQSNWVTVSLPTSPTSVNPVVAAASSLTGGTDDQAGVNDTLRQAGLNYFAADLGPGQVSIPGTLTSGNRTALIAHAQNNNRVALLDSTDTGTKSTLVSEGQSLQATGNEYAALFGPWVQVPGNITSVLPRTVAPVALAAGLIARTDASKGTAQPAAGINGIADWAIGSTQAPFTDADRQDLNNAGVNLLRTKNGDFQLYGYRTLGLSNGAWNTLSVQRTRMALVADLSKIADNFVFATLDGKGQTLAAFGGQLKAACEKYRSLGALFGGEADSDDPAYFVDTSSAVNTPTTLANNELRAVVSVRISGMAEYVEISLVKVANSESLAA